jgi:SAM-dependent methyltransferase
MVRDMAKTQPFDAYLNDYELWFEKHQFAYLSEVEAVRHFIPENKRGIEIGIGTGRFALPFGIMHGVEPSAAMRGFATRRGLMVYDGVAEDLPLAGESFDFALMVTTVCFVDDIVRSFQEVHRILRPGGVFIIGMVDKGTPLGDEYEKIKDKNKFYRVAAFYSTTEIISNLRQTGFGSIDIVQTVFGDLDSIQETQPFKAGYGEGGFVAMKAAKLRGR